MNSTPSSQNSIHHEFPENRLSLTPSERQGGCLGILTMPSYRPSPFPTSGGGDWRRACFCLPAVCPCGEEPACPCLPAGRPENGRLCGETDTYLPPHPLPSCRCAYFVPVLARAYPTFLPTTISHLPALPSPLYFTHYLGILTCLLLGGLPVEGGGGPACHPVLYLLLPPPH